MYIHIASVNSDPPFATLWLSENAYYVMEKKSLNRTSCGAATVFGMRQHSHVSDKVISQQPLLAKTENDQMRAS